MKNVLNKSVKQKLIIRVAALNKDDTALFGKMNCHEWYVIRLIRSEWQLEG